MINKDLLVRETVAGLLRQARREAGGRELRGLTWRMGIVSAGEPGLGVHRPNG